MDNNDIWNRNAAFWDRQIHMQGASWHTKLIDPAVDRLLKLQPGEQVLDVASGNGNFARRVA